MSEMEKKYLFPKLGEKKSSVLDMAKEGLLNHVPIEQMTLKNLTETDSTGRNVFHVAAATGQLMWIPDDLQAWDNMLEPDHRGELPLHLAGKHGHMWQVSDRLLVEGVLSGRNGEGKTVWECMSPRMALEIRERINSRIVETALEEGFSTIIQDHPHSLFKEFKDGSRFEVTLYDDGQVELKIRIKDDDYSRKMANLGQITPEEVARTIMCEVKGEGIRGFSFQDLHDVVDANVLGVSVLLQAGLGLSRSVEILNEAQGLVDKELAVVSQPLGKLEFFAEFPNPSRPQGPNAFVAYRIESVIQEEDGFSACHEEKHLAEAVAKRGEDAVVYGVYGVFEEGIVEHLWDSGSPAKALEKLARMGVDVSSQQAKNAEEDAENEEHRI